MKCSNCSRDAREGLTQCKVCSDYGKRWEKNNPEKLKEKRKRFYDAHRERMIELAKERQRKTVEATRERQKEQQQMSPEELLEYMGYKIRGKKNGNE